MDWIGDKQGTISRLAICAVAAFLLYAALEKLGEGDNLPMLGEYMPWIRENKVQAIAIVGAVLYGVSLALWPVDDKSLSSNENGPGEGYEPV